MFYFTVNQLQSNWETDFRNTGLRTKADIVPCFAWMMGVNIDEVDPMAYHNGVQSAWDVAWYGIVKMHGLYTGFGYYIFVLGDVVSTARVAIS